MISSKSVQGGPSGAVAEAALEASRLKREVTELRTRAGRSNKIIGKST